MGIGELPGSGPEIGFGYSSAFAAAAMMAERPEFGPVIPIDAVAATVAAAQTFNQKQPAPPHERGVIAAPKRFRERCDHILEIIDSAPLTPER